MKEKNIINVALAEDHVILREGLINLLNEEYEHIKVLFDVSNGRELLDELEESKPDVILLDIDMPVLNGKEALEEIKIKYPAIKVIMLSTHYNDSYIIEFIKMGASAYLSKASSMEEIVKAIDTVFEEGRYYDSGVLKALAKVKL
jgi:DNA-binding NarL/FixJ family response regulator